MLLHRQRGGRLQVDVARMPDRDVAGDVPATGQEDRAALAVLVGAVGHVRQAVVDVAELAAGGVVLDAVLLGRGDEVRGVAGGLELEQDDQDVTRPPGSSG